MTPSVPMNTAEISDTLTTLFGELVNGAGSSGAFVLNRGDKGLLKSLDLIDAEEASRSSEGGATIAAHAAHVRYGLSLMNRWAKGEENPFATADWSKAWETSTVTEAEWAGIRSELREECEMWLTGMAEPRDVIPIALNGLLCTIGHLGYHMGAMRQISSGMRGPKDAESPPTERRGEGAPPRGARMVNRNNMDLSGFYSPITFAGWSRSVVVPSPICPPLPPQQ